MASMIAYFGARSYNGVKDSKEIPSGSVCWDGSLPFATNVSKFCPDRQLKILLEQTLAASYFVRFYGLRCHELVTEFINELTSDVTYRFNRTCERSFKDAYQRIFSTINHLVKFMNGNSWEPVDVDLVCEFLFDGTDRSFQPKVWDNSDRASLQAFLYWMNGKDDGSANLTGDIKLFYFDFCFVPESNKCNMIEIHQSSSKVSNEFMLMKTPLDPYKDKFPVYSFISHCSLVDVKFETLIGVMSNYCFHEDIKRDGLTWTHKLAYCLRHGVLYPEFDIRGCVTGIELNKTRSDELMFQNTVAFVRFCTQYRGMKLTDRGVIAKAFGILAATKEQKQSADYLAGQKATPSAEEFKSFKKVMGSVESLDLISQSPTLISAQSSQVTASTEEASKDAGSGDSKPESDEGKDNTKEADPGKEEKDPGEEGGDGDASDADEPGESTDDPGEDDTSFDGGDSTEGSEGDGSDAGESGDSSTSTDMQSGTPESVSASDDTGIEFKFSPPESETVDTVLFREEMEKFLSNVLTNPPKCMSPQQVTTLIALKRYWLHCLSIETIMGIVEACIRLPKSFKNSVKSTE